MLIYFHIIMHLRQGEQVLKIYHRHLTPYVWGIIKRIIILLPVFALLFVLQESISSSVYYIIFSVLVVIYILIFIYFSFIYWLDKLVVTNLRVIFVNWRYLSVRDEAEAVIEDIQDIRTKEKGIFSYLKAFDYGDFRLDTASSNVVIQFDNAPDPEGIRHFIYNVRKQ